jgi:hypothetical protein
MKGKHMLSCGALGGRSPKTGKRVGERHRWSGGEWGNGHCEFCFRTLDEVLIDDKPNAGSPQHLRRALETTE